MPVVAMWTPEGGLLGVVAPLAMAMAAPGPALVIDLDPEGPAYPTPATLAEMVADGGPTRSDLEPRGRRLAILANGGVADPPGEVIAAFTAGWPHVVFRVPEPADSPAPLVPVVELWPGGLAHRPHRPAVYQEVGWRVSPPGPGVVLPRPGRAALDALLGGRRPGARDRWLRRWQQVWRLPWG